MLGCVSFLNDIVVAIDVAAIVVIPRNLVVIGGVVPANVTIVLGIVAVVTVDFVVHSYLVITDGVGVGLVEADVTVIGHIALVVIDRVVAVSVVVIDGVGEVVVLAELENVDDVLVDFVIIRLLVME